MENNQKEVFYFLNAEQAKFATSDGRDAMVLINLSCRNVRTGENSLAFIQLFPIFSQKDNSNSINSDHYYEEISNSVKKLSILCDLSNKSINPVQYTFDEVQSLYYSLINEGIKEEEIYSEMNKLLQSKSKGRVRSK